MNISAIFATSFARRALSKYIIPVTSLPNIMPISREIIINGIFNFLEITAEKTINIIMRAVNNNTVVILRLYSNSPEQLLSIFANEVNQSVTI